ncbi:hypothetical protein HMPREF1544_01476 [Mucor circinelloides 1006PhL]|uniref:F-box domain-containing protein n=1 Tax=Mucor circinelloides f. circinelloides (strain 1006PhL) TaxID=1220926 RepID=S2JTG2_MUCC1|nr:hypothetical protein HMPREF1544_01476 [Mucor circinelloides 1006PhL]
MFPTEILLNIFQHLSIYSQRQCLFVCKSWNAAARPFITRLDTNTRRLYGRNCLFRLARNTLMNTDYGLGIRRLELFLPTKTEHYNIQIDLIHILEGCHNLAEIIMRMYNPFPLVVCMVERRVDLPHLELILVDNKAQLLSLGFHYLNLASLYKATLNQLAIRIYAGAFSRFLAVDNISAYLQEFVNLKYLSLDTDCPVILDSILKACPRLQRLKLQVKLASFQLRKSGAMDQCSEFQLEVLDMDGHLISHDVYLYLAKSCKYLVQLILSNPCKQLYPIISTFHASAQDKSLQIANLTFKDQFPATAEMLQDINYWFPTVRQVELSGCNLSSLIDEHHNLLLDFNDLNLDYLSLDLDPLFNHNHRFLDRVALELVMDDFTEWWQRDGTAKSRQQFRVRNTKQYLHPSARQRRIQSNQTAVITIKAESILTLRLHFLKLDSPLDQTIMPLTQ